MHLILGGLITSTTFVYAFFLAREQMNAPFYFLFDESVEFLLADESRYFMDGYVKDMYIFLIAIYIFYYAIQLFIIYKKGFDGKES